MMAILQPKRVRDSGNTTPPATNTSDITRTKFTLTKKARILVLRNREGGYVDGYWKDGEYDYHIVYGNTQPLRGHELQVLPESDRSKESIKVYTTERLRTILEDGETKADCVIWDGKKFKVYQTATYQMGVLNHTKAWCVRFPLTPQDKRFLDDIPLGMDGVDGAGGMTGVNSFTGGVFVSSEVGL